MLSLEICYTSRKGIWVFGVIVPFCVDSACFFSSSFCSDAVAASAVPWSVSLEISSLALSLFYSPGPHWLFKVCDSRVGSRRKMLSLKVRCIPWAMREHMWMSLHWLLVLLSLLWTRLKHWPSVPLLFYPAELIRIPPPFFCLQLSKDLFFLVVATKNQKFL